MSVYAGKLLRVDLSQGTWHEEEIPEDAVRTWLLGSGYAAKLYYDEMDPAVEPLDPRNPLYVMNGVLAGTFAPTGCRSSWCGRAPLTGIWNEANLGNYWGAELRFAGYDGLVITGRAEKPVYLYINSIEGTIELRDAGHLWGKNYFETAETLAAEIDKRAQIAGIGTAGERLVKVAGIMSGPKHYVRAAARGGMGALLGSKNLKAIAVRGKDRPQYPDRRAFLATVKEQNAFIKENSIAMSNFGTAGGVIGTEQTGDMPMQNWQLGSWDTAHQISGQTIYDTIWVRHTNCFACPIGCGKEVEVPEGRYKTPRGEGVEYETLAGFGGMTRNDNLEAIALANSLCNDYGLDTISTSSVIAFALEAYEKEIIGPDETEGVALRFSDPEAVIHTLRLIAERRGVGDALAEGVREAARRLGDGAEDFAIHVKGLEIAYHDPRAFTSMAVNYATAARGGCHLEAISYWNGYGLLMPDLGYDEVLDRFASNEASARLAYDYQNYMSVYNPLGLCKFIAKGNIGPDRVCEIVNSALGWDWNAEALLETGDRIFQIKRLINLRLGVTPADDTLPKRLLTEPRPSGSAAGVLPDMDTMMPVYYGLREWDGETGAPSPARLERLGIAAR
ncbi:MAG: aldehyde ferredoxin oxidoreductase family protein [Anaerolineae bacterium]